MTQLNIRNLTMPIAAFSMVFVLGGYIWGAMGAAKANAHIEREKKFAEITRQREEFGIGPSSRKREE